VRDVSQNGLSVAAAVNADFFADDGKPVGLCVQDGQIVTPPAEHPVFGVTDQGKPFIENVEIHAAVFSQADTHVLAINYRKQNAVCLFNRFYGDSLSLKPEEIAYEISMLDTWNTNGIIQGVIVTIDSIAVQAIPETGALLVSQSEKRLGIVGDTLKLPISLPPLSVPVRHAVGGIPRIVRDGEVSVEWKHNSFNLERHPRTAVGFTREKKTLFIVTVDGRQPEYSDGMTLDELAHFMIDIGVYQALNLDGGGSTTMVIFGEVVNRPSDVTGERLVSNALYISTK